MFSHRWSAAAKFSWHELFLTDKVVRGHQIRYLGFGLGLFAIAWGFLVLFYSFWLKFWHQKYMFPHRWSAAAKCSCHELFLTDKVVRGHQIRYVGFALGLFAIVGGFLVLYFFILPKIRPKNACVPNRWSAAAKFSWHNLHLARIVVRGHKIRYVGPILIIFTIFRGFRECKKKLVPTWDDHQHVWDTCFCQARNLACGPYICPR